MGTSKAPVAVSKTATITIATNASKKVSQCGFTYCKSRLKSSIEVLNTRIYFTGIAVVQSLIFATYKPFVASFP